MDKVTIAERKLSGKCARCGTEDAIGGNDIRRSDYNIPVDKSLCWECWRIVKRQWQMMQVRE